MNVSLFTFGFLLQKRKSQNPWSKEKEFSDSSEAIKDPGKARDQMFAAEPIDMILSCPSGLVAQALGCSWWNILSLVESLLVDMAQSYVED